MAGYTRQSVSQIINGADITAPPLNAEFNALLAAFNAGTGHGHTGATGEAPQIPLGTSVSGYLLALNGGSGGKNNFSASSPTITDDVGDGYAIGSLWINTTSKRIFICTANTSNAATWHEIVANTGTVLAPETHNTVDIGTTAVRYKDFYLAGNADVDGTLNVLGTTTATHIDTGTITSTGLGTFATVDVNGGQVDGAIIGGNSASAITGTQITANSGFVGDVTGNVAGNVTSAGTSGFNNITASGTIQGAVTGDITGNVTATSGSSQFNNVQINGTLNMDGTTTATIQNLTDPTNAQDAATKAYVDTGLSNLVASSPAALDTLNELAASLNNDASFSTTMTNALAGKVADTGDTMTGNLIMSGSTVTGLPLPTANTEAASKQYADQQDNLQVTKTGDSMSGNLSMGTNKIVNLGAPSSNLEATNKQYVDGILGSSTAAATSAANAATSESNAATSAVNAAASAVTAATAIVSSQQFLDTYFISASQPTGAAVTIGDLWFDTASNTMKVYGASGFQSAGSSVNGTAERKEYIVGTSAGTYGGSLTTFPAVYDPSYCDVYLNGLKLAPSDFTATDGANVVLGAAATVADTISIVSFGTFTLADHYDKTTTDTLLSDVEALALAGM
tara:strand:- start:50 stop:1921 length:1872 start_codon:yes stop_codon:yes gene_type:complete